MSRNQRLNATLTIGATMQASVRRNFDVVGRGLRNIASEISTVTARKRELDRERAVLVRQGQAVDALDREYRELTETLRRLEDRQRRIRNLQTSLAGVGSAFNTMTGEVTRFARRTTVVVGAASAAIFGLANSTATLGDDVGKTADRLGVGIGALQEYRYAAERTGIGAAAMDSAFESMNRNIGDASMGMGRAGRVFDQLGLSLEELSGMAVEDRFEAIAGALGDMEDQTQAAALSQRLFGQDMSNLTRLSAEQRRTMRQDGRNLGFVLDDRTVRAAEAFRDAMLNAGLALQGMRNTIGAELMPIVGKAMTGLTVWLGENRKTVQDFAQRFAAGLRDVVPVIGQIVSGLADVAGHVGRGITRLAEFVGGWDKLGAVVGTLFAGRAIASVLAFGVALGKLGVAAVALAAPVVLPAIATGIGLIGAALVANPIGASITAIALGAALIIQNWDKIRPHLEPIFEWIGQALTFVNENVVQPFFGAIATGVQIGIEAWETFRAALGEIIEWLGEKFDALMRRIQPVLNAGAALRDIGASVVTGVGDTIMGRGPVSSGSGGRAATRRQVGGSFLPGAVLVGEAGPELRFEDRAGFIATNRQLQAMADRVASIRDLAFAGAGELAGRSEQVVHNTVAALHVHAAPGMDARALVDQIEAEWRRRGRGALYDRQAARPL
jgi:hypothetical protein